MKRLVMALSLVVCWGIYSCWADPGSNHPEPFFGTPAASAVLNAPSMAIQGAQMATNMIQPGVETLYDFRQHSWKVGTSAALYTFSSKSFPIASLRAGYAPVEEIYGELQLDLAGIAHRFLPDSIKQPLSAGALDGLWNIISKYGQVGAYAGYNFDTTSDGTNHAGGVAVGVVLGGKLTF